MIGRENVTQGAQFCPQQIAAPPSLVTGSVLCIACGFEKQPQKIAQSFQGPENKGPGGLGAPVSSQDLLQASKG